MLAITEDHTLTVKLITEPGERELYSDLITRRHYLGSSVVNRNTIVHVVRRGRQDVAVVTWEPELRLWFSLRDRVIGWTAEQKEGRLKYCVENRRYLVLVEEKNLASQALTLSMKRLSTDGEKLFGHDFLLAETFVDPARGYDGTCYKAAGWTEAGLTKGGRGKQERSAKLYFVKELKKDGLAKLKAPNLTPSDTSNPRQSKLCLDGLNLESLRRKLEEVPDYRKHEGKNPLPAILAVLCVAVLCGATNTKEAHRWVRDLSWEILKDLGFRRPLTYTTAWRVMTRTDNAALSQKLCEWLKEHADKIHIAGNIRQLAFDGKTQRSASKGKGSPIHVVSLIDVTAGVLIGQRMTNDKEKNEIPCARTLLESADIDATTLTTGDAMHTQHETVEIPLKKTVITSSPSKITSQTYAVPSQKKPQRRPGRYQSLLRTLATVA